MSRKCEERRKDRWWLVDAGDLPQELVFIELFKAAKLRGIKPPEKYKRSLEPSEARSLLEEHGGKIAFYEGRILCLDLSRNPFNAASYDRHNHEPGTAARLIARLRTRMDNQETLEM